MNLIAGGAAGFLATLPMSGTMSLLHRALPRDEQYALPPTEITGQLLKKAGLPEIEKPRRRRAAATYLSHFSYGTLCGVVHAATGWPRSGGTLRRGILLGTTIWAVSYLGFLPLLRVLRPATEHPPERNLLMIFAHWVFGVSTVAAFRKFNQEKYS